MCLKSPSSEEVIVAQNKYCQEQCNVSLSITIGSALASEDDRAAKTKIINHLRKER